MMGVLLTILDPEAIRASLDAAKSSLVNENLGNFSAIGRTIGAVGALLYIAYRVWGHLSRAEPIDVFPLLKPFALGILIINFNVVIGFLDSIVDGITNQTTTIVADSNTDLSNALEKWEEAKKDQLEKAYNQQLGISPEEEEAIKSGNITGFVSSIKNIVININESLANFDGMIYAKLKEFLNWFLMSLKGFATVAIDTVSTFFLVVLSLLGPIVFGVACFDGFGHMLTNWLSRYVSIALWLPIAKILTLILNNIELEILNAQTAELMSSGVMPDSWIFTAFYFMGIIAFFTVPTIAGWVVDAGSGAGSLLSKTVSVAMLPVNMAGAAAGAAIGGASGAVVAGRMTSGVTKVAKGDDAPQG